MAPPGTDFPAIRACIFDMDGLLVNSEDIITHSTNQLLEKNGRPALTRSIRAQLMDIPNSTNGDVFHDWARLPIPREQFAHESAEQINSSRERIEMALASNTKSHSYELKTFFQPDRRPAPDIYLVALQALNSGAGSGKKPLLPNECLVFEDTAIGVEAARRAGMRVVWVPHPDVAVGYQGRRKEVLAGRMRMNEVGDDWQLGDIDDGWAEHLPSLEQFDYGKYGIDVTI
ncbi:putative haloacid dehalogenase-like hydrolase [Aspergillus desertorum]